MNSSSPPFFLLLFCFYFLLQLYWYLSFLFFQPVLKNRWAILYFLMSVGEDSSSKYSHGQVHVMCIKLIMIQINSMIVNYFLSFFWIHYKKVISVVNCSYIELRNGTTQGFQKCRIFVLYIYFQEMMHYFIVNYAPQIPNYKQIIRIVEYFVICLSEIFNVQLIIY